MVVRYLRALIIVYLFFPLSGLLVIVFSVCTGKPLGMEGVLIVLTAFSFTPLLTAMRVWMARRSKLGQGPFTYSFDSEGIQTRGAAFDQTIKWAAILRVRQSKQFLFVFISPSRAFCIPLKALTEQGVLDQVLAIVREHTDLR